MNQVHFYFMWTIEKWKVYIFPVNHVSHNWLANIFFKLTTKEAKKVNFNGSFFLNKPKIFFFFIKARILLTGSLEDKGPSILALSPDSFTIAVASLNQLSFYDGLTGECDQSIENFCNGIFLCIIILIFKINQHSTNSR